MWPSSIVITVSIAWPPKRSWYFDVVLVDLVVGVQVAVLAGGELELGDAEPEHQCDEQADDRDQPGPLAELDREALTRTSACREPSTLITRTDR